MIFKFNVDEDTRESRDFSFGYVIRANVESIAK
jgi:hypothetical protein